MTINSQFTNNSAVLPKVGVERFQKQAQRAQINGTTSSSAEGVASQAVRESIDQVQLSPAARQAYASLLADDSQTRQPSSALQEQNPSLDNQSQLSPVNSSIAEYQRHSESSAQETSAAVNGQPSVESDKSDAVGENRSATVNLQGGDSVELSPEAQQKIIELSQRNQEVIDHEAAHAAVGGRYAGAPTLEYETGPDGKRYAVSGEVSIDTSEVKGDPAATIKKAEIIRAAALAPKQPSAQDLRVAAKATQMKAKAKTELAAETAAAADAMVKRASAFESARKDDVSAAGSLRLSDTEPAAAIAEKTSVSPASISITI
ncbi:MAG: hypothetical protein B6I36_04700 [Desulfobacteraceae bacterium 4572_35.1]|nr:MAG: hypothetical protein B6I36_04700 [Desulfobacteraceae bacterium 4572_35.1]